MTQPEKPPQTQTETEQKILEQLALQAMETLLLPAAWKLGKPIPGQMWINAYGEEMLGEDF